jgi:hypothetical protein
VRCRCTTARTNAVKSPMATFSTARTFWRGNRPRRPRRWIASSSMASERSTGSRAPGGGRTIDLLGHLGYQFRQARCLEALARQPFAFGPAQPPLEGEAKEQVKGLRGPVPQDGLEGEG